MSWRGIGSAMRVLACLLASSGVRHVQAIPSPVRMTQSDSLGVHQADSSSKVIVRSMRTNHPHDRAASAALAVAIRDSMPNVEVVEEVRGLERRHDRWDRADGLGVAPDGSPSFLPGDLVIVVEEVATIVPRAVYDISMEECRLTWSVEIRTARDAVEVERRVAQALAVDASAEIALRTARSHALEEVADPLCIRSKEILGALREGRLGVLVECVDGDVLQLRRALGPVGAAIELADDRLDGAAVAMLTEQQWRTVAESGVAVLDVRPGWVLVSCRSDAPLGGESIRWIFAVVMMVVMAVIALIAARRFKVIRSSFD